MPGATAGLVVDLSPGAGVAVEGREWTVASFEPHCGVVLLAGGDGQVRRTTVRALVAAGCRQIAAAVPGEAGESVGRQPAAVDDLSEAQRQRVVLRLAHVLEAETGYRGGDRLRPGPGEPRPAYDPAVTTVGQRRRAKAAELAALGRDEAAVLGLGQVSVRTLERLAAGFRRFGVAGCIDGRMLRRGGDRPSVTEAVREAIWAVHAETLHRSRVSMKTRERMVHQYVRENFGEEVPVPCYTTLRTVWVDWFGPGGARQRYARSAAAVAATATGDHVVVHRPGQVVALDTTECAVLVRENVFGEPVAASLTLALDVHTHSLVAFRLTLVSDTSVDVAMLLRDVMMPLPLRADWGPEMEWPYPGVPAAVVAEFAGHRVAGLPFFAPETVTTDHGAVYKNHHLVEVQRVIGANILPARVLRPTDKQAVERAFGGIQSLLFEFLLGYRGVDVADRGADPQADAVLTITELEHLIATWIVKVWQNRVLGEYAPAWDPGGRHSPNTLFAASMAQGGFALQIPTPQLFYQLLPAHYVQVHGRRGVKIKGLWYDGPALDGYRAGPSARGGAHKGKWVIRRDPRDRRTVYFQDPATGDWQVLRWTGLPPDGEVPSFADARVAELLRAARGAGLTPKSDAELLPVLLELVGAHTPVEAWPTQMPKHKRTGHAREATQADAAAVDRPTVPTTSVESAAPNNDAPVEDAAVDGAAVVPLRWRQRGRQAAAAVDDERRRRREQAMAGRAPTPPARLGDHARRHSLLVLPDEDAGLDPDQPAGDRPQSTEDSVEAGQQ